MPAVDRTLCQAGHVPQKPPSWNEIRHNLTEFSAEWGAETREHAEYASFWDALLRCYGVERRRVATFQQQAKRASTGNSGFIDFFWPKVAIGEHKSLGKAGVEGQDAEDQAFDYLAGGSIDPADFPRYVISTDFATIRVTDLDADGGPASSYFPITDLRDHAEELGFLGGATSQRQSRRAIRHRLARPIAGDPAPHGPGGALEAVSDPLDRPALVDDQLRELEPAELGERGVSVSHEGLRVWK